VLSRDVAPEDFPRTSLLVAKTARLCVLLDDDSNQHLQQAIRPSGGWAAAGRTCRSKSKRERGIEGSGHGAPLRDCAFLTATRPDRRISRRRVRAEQEQGDKAVSKGPVLHHAELFPVAMAVSPQTC